MSDRLRDLALENALLKEKLFLCQKKEQMLKEHTETLRAITTAAHDAIIMRDNHGAISFWNKAAEETFGYTSAEALNCKLPLLFAPQEDNSASIFQAVQDRMAQGKTLEMVAVRKDGSTFPVELSLSQVRIRGKWQVIHILRDITHRKEAESTLMRAKEQAEAVSRMKSDFITSISHELRTPLTSISGFVRIIQKRLQSAVFPQLDSSQPQTQRAVEQVQSNLEIMVSETRRLTELINDVLTLSWLEEGKVEWRMAPTNLEDMLRRAMAVWDERIRSKGLEPRMGLPGDLPLALCDPPKIMQVLVNLFSNAVKFTEEGSVTLAAVREGARVVVSVTDTGVGAPFEESERIFEKFRQLGDPLTAKPSGAGLGLAICKEIITRHGGEIWVEPAPGGGSAFRFTLCVATDEAADAHQGNP